jgi:hypothetical protein
VAASDAPASADDSEEEWSLVRDAALLSLILTCSEQFDT